MDMGDRVARTGVVLTLLSAFMLPPAWAEPTPPTPASAQPDLPNAPSFPLAKPTSSVVDAQSDAGRPPLDVRKRMSRPTALRRHMARFHHHSYAVERPALAGVELVEPLPPPPEPPHLVVPTPAYPLDSLASAFITPPPPVVCHRTRRDPEAPDPHLYREAAVECVPDNP